MCFISSSGNVAAVACFFFFLPFPPPRSRLGFVCRNRQDATDVIKESLSKREQDGTSRSGAGIEALKGKLHRSRRRTTSAAWPARVRVYIALLHTSIFILLDPSAGHWCNNKRQRQRSGRHPLLFGACPPTRWGFFAGERETQAETNMQHHAGGMPSLSQAVGPWRACPCLR